jgi:hypothetical protein
MMESDFYRKGGNEGLNGLNDVVVGWRYLKVEVVLFG